MLFGVWFRYSEFGWFIGLIQVLLGVCMVGVLFWVLFGAWMFCRVVLGGFVGFGLCVGCVLFE